MEFSRQEHWSGLPFLSPGDLPNPGIEHMSPALQMGFSLCEPPGKPIPEYICLFFKFSLCLHVVSVFVCVLILSFYKDTSHIGGFSGGTVV